MEIVPASADNHCCQKQQTASANDESHHTGSRDQERVRMGDQRRDETQKSEPEIEGLLLATVEEMNINYTSTPIGLLEETTL
jgi:hypothetical protein